MELTVLTLVFYIAAMDALPSDIASPIEEDQAQWSIVSYLGKSTGAGEPAIRLLLTILLGYPIAAIYRYVVEQQSAKLYHHLYFAVCGFSLCFFNYGFDTYHSLICLWTTFLLTRVLYNMPDVLVVVNFIFQFSYLLIGYYFTESNEYDILWTMPHCILVLRLIGLGFDIADGRKPMDKLSKEQKEVCLRELPTLMEMTAFAYFPCSFIVGPQFPQRRYQRFIEGEFREHKGGVKTGLTRMSIGILYLALRQMGTMVIPDSYFLSDDFANEQYLMKIIYLCIWGKFSLYKYISCWLLAEGSLMCIGLSYAGKTANGDNNWYGCSNVNVILFETGQAMQSYVHSFNVNTNQWVSQYVYKRLKFLNNRTISYVAALSFLAVWHGFHSGYYMAFLTEYMVVTSEKQIAVVFNALIMPRYENLTNSMAFKVVQFVVLKTYNLLLMGWSLIPFTFLNYPRWICVFAEVHYFGFIYLALWCILYQCYKYHARRTSAREIKTD